MYLRLLLYYNHNTKVQEMSGSLHERWTMEHLSFYPTEWMQTLSNNPNNVMRGQLSKLWHKCHVLWVTVILIHFRCLCHYRSKVILKKTEWQVIIFNKRTFYGITGENFSCNYNAKTITIHISLRVLLQSFIYQN
jgi:hypothetical protein